MLKIPDFFLCVLTPVSVLARCKCHSGDDSKQVRREISSLKPAVLLMLCSMSSDGSVQMTLRPTDEALETVLGTLTNLQGALGVIQAQVAQVCCLWSVYVCAGCCCILLLSCPLSIFVYSFVGYVVHLVCVLACMSVCPYVCACVSVCLFAPQMMNRTHPASGPIFAGPTELMSDCPQFQPSVTKLNIIKYIQLMELLLVVPVWMVGCERWVSRATGPSGRGFPASPSAHTL